MRRMNNRFIFVLALAASLSFCGCNDYYSPSHESQFLPHPQRQAGAEQIIHYGCGTCHVIPGIPGAVGQVGPPLTGVGNRTYIAGELPNTRGNIQTWVMHPHSIHPKTAMPEMGITQGEAEHIADYLTTLR
jgi:cytochrome c2